MNKHADLKKTQAKCTVDDRFACFLDFIESLQSKETLLRNRASTETRRHNRF